ncbi:MAG: hypothetical protein CR982_07235 [Candidatus Cloacimonadota bacterium]|nr:MAG: hypothetical protein CR982_07235 [Candidatus Cloacimonadota bacterium]PIE78294.1 MAG: hypothetical protein CSA15_08515 [Candidatus Delongbacteria bacterium]
MDREYIGIIVNQFKQKSTLVNYLLTENYGLIKFSIYGISKKNSIYRAIIEPLNKISVTLSGNKKFIEAELLESNQEIRKSYKKIEFSLKILNFFNRFSNKTVDKSYCFYNLIERFLTSISNINNPPYNSLEISFYYYYIFCLGVGLPIYKNIEGNKYIKISLDDGAISNSERAFPLSVESYKILQKISISKFSNIDWEISPRCKLELKNFLREYIYNHFNQNII